MPSSLVAVIVAFPSLTLAVTLPLLSTVAILVSLDFQVTFLFVALFGVIVAVRALVSFCLRVKDSGVTLKPVTLIGLTVTS